MCTLSEVSKGATVVIVISVLAGLALGFVFLPIRMGAIGSVTEEGVGFRIWVRPWAGLLGGGLDQVGAVRRVGPMLGSWFPWGKRLKKKEAVAEKEAGKEEKKEEEEVEEEKEEEPEPVVQTLRERVDHVLVLVERGYAYLQELGPAAGRFLKRLGRVLGLHQVMCDVVLGTGNPALTGRLFGYVQALTAVMGPRIKIYMQPDFVQTKVIGNVKLELSFYLYRLIWAVVCLLGSGLKAFGKDWWGKRKRKRAVLAQQA